MTETIPQSTTPLTPQAIVAQIYKSDISRYGDIDGKPGYPTIEIDCSTRRQHTTDEEKQLLTTNGYVELYNHLVVGWDIWILAKDLQSFRSLEQYLT